MPVPIPKMAATPFLQRPKLRWPSIPFPVTATALPALMWEFLKAGTGRNVIPDNAVIKFETRGGSTAINEFMEGEARRMIKAAADMYGVTVKMVARGVRRQANSSPDMGEEVYEVVKGLGVYSDIEKNHTVSGSEDCSYFMSRVQDHGRQGRLHALWDGRSFGSSHQ